MHVKKLEYPSPMNLIRNLTFGALFASLAHAFVPSKFLNADTHLMSTVGSSPPMSTVDDDSDGTENKEHNLVNENASLILGKMPSTLGVVSEADRAEINELLLKLEAMNPTTSKPAYSPLLNGLWKLKYSGGYVSEGALPSPSRQVALFLYSGGYSPGMFALSLAESIPNDLVSIGELEIEICENQPRVQASLKIKSPLVNSSIKVNTRLETKSDYRLRETYESVEAMGQRVEVPKPLQYSRDLFITYLDEDLLVVRDGSGIPECLVRSNGNLPFL